MLPVHAVILLFIFFFPPETSILTLCAPLTLRSIYIFFSNLNLLFSGFYRNITLFTHAHKLKFYLRYGKLTISNTKSSHHSLYLRRRSFCACHWRLAPLHHTAWHTKIQAVPDSDMLDAEQVCFCICTTFTCL